ncbi:hypothetical protein QBC34DRAFT_144673 [Podospora aff. communis PSN243]|uniref:Hypervirulence associated protein TUDOR domain-containing protein n=1 Tax=Podospora aff. communis PSN243 TaxID=3040156 RepID=A0AAV9GDQ7_9PEZI|nr:hypothetical protein QBC34DRAFT_144673 [Podospora aff. communis PSN243]
MQMGSRAQEFTMGDRLVTSWHEASRVGRIVWAEANKAGRTLNRIRVLATSPPAPIDDGWEIIDGKDADPPSDLEPERNPPKHTPNPEELHGQAPSNSTVSTSQHNLAEEDVVRNYRYVERELKQAISQGFAEIENRLRTELSKLRHEVWEKDMASWSAASTHGGRHTAKMHSSDGQKDRQGKTEEAETALVQEEALGTSKKDAVETQLANFTTSENREKSPYEDSAASPGNTSPPSGETKASAPE